MEKAGFTHSKRIKKGSLAIN